ncbi:inorganic phosphate transporter [Alicyclobacillus macrosporangiidus]|uniref:inorganic phosphate transporter n=1 Tax=Alicyclobacillus macrosporangiidus TaxID=392015 RepID=UPI000555694F|nr:inorganic phosphate transporter [Alicyclobacillus macrosporangiidus]
MNDLLAVALVMGFTVLCGFNDGGNLLATFLNTRVMHATIVLGIILAGVLLAPFLLGTAVATTIGTRIVDIRQAGVDVLNVSLAATLVTLLVCWRLKVPTSTSFALVGGLSGSGLAMLGPHAVVWWGLLQVGLSLVLAVVLGGLAGYLTYYGLYFLLRLASARLGRRVGYLQYVSALMLCIGYGANDAEKSVGLLATVNAVAHHEPFRVTPWMVVVPGIVFFIGLLWGGWRVARSVGFHVFRARPVHSFATQVASAAVVIGASALGGPVSSTQTIDSALVGVGVCAGKERIRWSFVRRMLVVWGVTMPLAFVVAVVLALLCKAGGVM